MGILDKAKGLFIEKEEDNNLINYKISPADRKAYSLSTDTDTSTVEVADIDTSKLISINDVYNENNLSDKDKSIYRVNEIKAVLPDMPNDAKKASITGMLTVSNIGISEIEDDSKIRTGVLIETLDKFTSETDKIVVTAQDLIEQKEAEIEELKTTISDRKKLQEKQASIFVDELDLIDKTLKFITE